MANLDQSTCGPESGSCPFDPSCPYPGLRPFEEADAALFFGRRRLVEELLTQLEFQPMVLLLGSSGCGKTSVVRAGVIPRWREKYPTGKVISFRPGSNPFESLAEALTGFPETTITAFRTPDSKVFRHFGISSVPSPRILVAIDPIEDLFTQIPAGKAALRQDFLDSLVDLARLSNSGIQLLLTLRDDFVAHLGDHVDFHRIADNSLQRITSLKGEALRECIEAPASSRGVRFDAGLVESLQLQSEARDGALPLLQDTLSTWWREEDLLKERLLRRSTLERIGGLEGALPQRLDRWYDSLRREDQKSARSALLQLVDWSAPREGFPPVLRSKSRSSMGAAASEELLRSMLEQRFLVIRGTQSDPVLELGHESLVQAWPVLRTWVEEMRSATAIRQRLQEDAQRWSASKGRAKRDLRWKSYRLEQSLELQERGDYVRLGGLSAVETRFLRSSHRARSLRTLRDRVLSVAVGLLAVLSLGAIMLTLGRFRDADSQKRAAEIKAGLGWLVRAQSAEGSTDAGFFAAFATGFDGAGREAAPPHKPEKPSVLALLAGHPSDPFPRYLTLQETPSRKIEADRRMASAPKPFIWSSPFDSNSGPVQIVSFSLDGRRLASAGADGRVRIWSVVSGTPERVLDGSTSSVQDIDFSPTGKLLASGHADGSLILWDISSGKKMASFQGHASAVRAVAFRPDGSQIASGGDDGAIKLWKVEAGGDTHTLSGHSGPVHCLAFGPGGKLLASGGSDRFIRVWDVDRGEEVNILSGHLDAVKTLAFSPSGRELASASRDQAILLWDLVTNKTSSSLPLPAPARSLAFSPDGEQLAVAGEDGRLRLLGFAQDHTSQVFSGHSGPIRTLAFSPDGKIVATGSDDRTVKLWAVRDAWKKPAHRAGDPAQKSPPPSGASDGFDWFRYAHSGWVRYDEHSANFVWDQLPGGLPIREAQIPPNSWLGVLHRSQGETQTRELLNLAIEAQNWEVASRLRMELPNPSELPALDPSAAKLLLRRIQDDLLAGNSSLAEWRMAQGDSFLSRNAEWIAMRGEYLERKGDSNGALRFFRQVPGLEGRKAVARLSADPKEAVDAWRQVLREETKLASSQFSAAGKRAAEAGDPSAVREFFSAGLERFPNDRALKIAYTRQLVELGAADEALAQCSSMAGDSSDVSKKLIQVLEEAQCLEPVLRLLEKEAAARKISGPEKAATECLEKLARLYQAANRPDDTLRVLRDRVDYLQKLHNDASLSGPLADLAKALAQAGHKDEALSVKRSRIALLKAQPLGPELEAALTELQNEFDAAGLSSEAIGLLQERIAVRKSLPGAPVSGLLAELATALKKAGRLNEAFPAMEQRVAALQAEGKDPIPAIREWAEALQSAGKTPEAWVAYRRITALPGSTVPTLVEVASWGVLHGNRKDATALFEEANSRASGDGERALVARRRGWALLEVGASEDAFLVLGMAKAQFASAPNASELLETELLSGLSAALWLSGRKGAAIDEFEALQKAQKDGEHWEDPGFIRKLGMPSTGSKALLELQAVWMERAHPTPPPKRK